MRCGIIIWRSNKAHQIWGVMPALVAGIHVFDAAKTQTPATSAGMTPKSEKLCY
jgi:hypothetical protein